MGHAHEVSTTSAAGQQLTLLLGLGHPQMLAWERVLQMQAVAWPVNRIMYEPYSSGLNLNALTVFADNYLLTAFYAQLLLPCKKIN
jgi:hypothetical protein